MRAFVIILCVLVGLIIGLAAAKFSRETRPADGKLQVTATIFPLADWLREIGGEDITVHLLVSGSNNPHHFEPTIQDAMRITHSRALFAVGLGLDPWAEKLAQNAGSSVLFIATAGWIKPRPMQEVTTVEVGEAHGRDEDEHHHGSDDPHYWLDPQRAISVVEHLRDELCKLDAPHGEKYKQRAAEYIAKLKTLDAEVDAAAKLLPKDAQVVTFHDAYGYLFERLGIKVAAVVQVSPGVEPGTRDLSEAIRIMKQLGQKVVFQEPTANTAATKLVAQELNAKIETLDPMDSELTSAGKTYLERFAHDISALKKALAGGQ